MFSLRRLTFNFQQLTINRENRRGVAKDLREYFTPRHKAFGFSSVYKNEFRLKLEKFDPSE